MSLPVFIACLWVLASAIVAMLPMRRQYLPGVGLLIVAPFLILWLGYAHGWWWVVIGALAFGSMFRNPLIYMYKRARGERPALPKEFTR